MNKIYYFILVFVFSSFSSSAQNDSLIRFRNTFLGFRFDQAGNRMNLKEVSKVMLSNEDAYKEIRKARNRNTVGLILSYAGGFVMGYGLGAMLNPNYHGDTKSFYWVGGGLIVAAIPFTISAKAKSERAVALYNEGIHPQSRNKGTGLNLQFSGNNLGLAFRF